MLLFLFFFWFFRFFVCFRRVFAIRLLYVICLFVFVVFVYNVFSFVGRLRWSGVFLSFSFLCLFCNTQVRTFDFVHKRITFIIFFIRFVLSWKYFLNLICFNAPKSKKKKKQFTSIYIYLFIGFFHFVLLILNSFLTRFIILLLYKIFLRKKKTKKLNKMLP